MKKLFRFLTAFALMAVLAGACSVTAMAAGDEFLDGRAFAQEGLKTISTIQEKSLTSGVKTVALGESHCAVLFEDGTVTAFQNTGWFNGVFDFGECETRWWTGIKEITCRAECTIGLRNDGSIVWTGNPNRGGFDNPYVEPDEGWKKISTGRNYTDIVSAPYMPLFALNADGTVDVAFDYGACDSIRQLTNIIDILAYDCVGRREFAALASDGTVTVFSSYGVEEKSFACKGAEKICVREERLCAVMKSGSIKDLGYSLAAIGTENAVSGLQPKGTVSSCWMPVGAVYYNSFMARMENGDVYWAITDHDGGCTVKNLWDLKNLVDAYMIALSLQRSADKNSTSERLEIILCVMESGELRAEYNIP